MTRNTILSASLACAGLMMVNCSSSSSSGGSSSSESSSGSKSSSTGSSGSKTSSSGSSKSSGSASSSSASKSASSSSAFTGYAPFVGSDAGAAAGDYGKECVTPDGGTKCSPGTITCGTGPTCDLTTEYCCHGASTDSCLALTKPCSPASTSTPVLCQEAADCPTGEVCCIATPNTASGVVSCQALIQGAGDAGMVCPPAPGPTTVAQAQICRSDNECASKKCQDWNCAGTEIEACANPVPADPILCCVIGSAGCSAP